MPFAIFVCRDIKASPVVWDNSDLIFDDAAQASAYCKQENHWNNLYGNTIRYRVKPISLDDPLAWRHREQLRIDSGEYKLPPWHKDGWNSNMLEHIDPDDPTKIRFFKCPEDAWRGKYTSMAPGRFFRGFIDSCIGNSYINKWCAAMGLDMTVSKLQIARTPEDIYRVYTEGPHSCMSYKKDTDSPFYSKTIHPVEIYGDSDLGVAFILRNGEITGRAIVWPDKKLHGRIYGDFHRMSERLSEEGYVEEWNFIGAKINVRKKRNRFIVPYLDGDAGVVVIDNKLIISDNPTMILKSPYGTPTATACDACGKTAIIEARYNSDGDLEGCYCREGCT